jgi:hypothetical protein
MQQTARLHLQIAERDVQAGDNVRLDHQLVQVGKDPKLLDLGVHFEL